MINCLTAVFVCSNNAHNNNILLRMSSSQGAWVLKSLWPMNIEGWTDHMDCFLLPSSDISMSRSPFDQNNGFLLSGKDEQVQAKMHHLTAKSSF